MSTVLPKKPFASKEKTPVVWYSHKCTPASHHPDALPLLTK
jgi:hypothetical protein